MIQVTKSITTETAHRLLNYAGKCSAVHGHSYKFVVTASFMKPLAELLPNGLSVDFGALKDAMQTFIHKPWDHSLLLHRDDPIVQFSQEHPDTFYAIFGDSVQRILGLTYNPTAECLAEDIGLNMEPQLRLSLRKNLMEQYKAGVLGPSFTLFTVDNFVERVRIDQVEVYETATSSAVWKRD